MNFSGQQALDVISRIKAERERQDQFLRWLLTEFNYALNYQMAQAIANKAKIIYERTGE